MVSLFYPPYFYIELHPSFKDLLFYRKEKNMLTFHGSATRLKKVYIRNFVLFHLTLTQSSC